MHSEMLDEIFLKDLMFDDFKAKGWSDALDERDFENAKTEYETEVNYNIEYAFATDEKNDARETAIGFVNCWIDRYYGDIGFDNGLLSFEIEKWGDDGPDTIYYEIEIKRDNKQYQTMYIGLCKRADGEWGIFEVQTR